MADVKISQLTALASASSDVAADVLAIVDTSVPQTKKITIENLVSPITLDKSNSRIGIGTSSPAQILDVQGGRTHLKSNDEYNLRLYASNGDSGKFIGTPAGDKLSIYSDVGNAEVTVDASGNVKMEAGALQLADVAQSIDFIQSGAINFDSNNDQTGRVLTIGCNRANGATGGTAIATFTEDGNVGIGETSPTGLLELAASGNTNKYLTLDNATGNNFIQFGADNGAYACMWTEYGSGDLYIGTGVKPVGTNTNAFYSSYGGGNISRTAIVMDAFGDQGIKFHTASESTVAKDSAVTNAERMRLEHSGNLVMQNKTNGLANNIKFAGTASYDNGSYTSHSLSGSGAIVIDDFVIKQSRIETASTDMTFVPGSGQVNVQGTGSIRIPAGSTAERPTVPAVGMIRYNTTTSKFEGYDGNWIVLTGVYDLDADTYITAELTPGANDNTIRFYSNGNLIASITQTEFNVAKINVDSIQIDGNTISTTTANTDLNLIPNGTGGVQIDNFNISGSTINNTSSGAVSVLDPGTGYFQIAGTDAFIVPAGTGSQRHTSPVLGMTRWNTTDGRLEIYDGSAWDTVAGSSGAVSQTDAQNIALELVLSLG